jgi:dCTP deaminase
MISSGSELAKLIELGNRADPKGICVVPEPDLVALAASGEAAVTLRLGRWFLSLRQTSKTHFDIIALKQKGEGLTNEERDTRLTFVPFGKTFTLHPGRFVLGSTLEWLRLPQDKTGYVTGKSSLGRRGLIIETAAGIHPGFSGCLTLELANVGEIPVQILPGMPICQVFVQDVKAGSKSSASTLAGRRRPFLGSLKPDEILQKLSGQLAQKSS